MSGSIVVVLLILAVLGLVAIARTVVVVVRDGRGQLPVERSDRPWMAGNLPSVPYSVWRS
jgi:hypothetical protein